MKKQLFLFVLSLLCFGSTCAQTDRDTLKGKQWWAEPTFTVSYMQGGDASQSVGLNLGWDFTRRFTAFAHIETGPVLKKGGDPKTWFPHSNA